MIGNAIKKLTQKYGSKTKDSTAGKKFRKGVLIGGGTALGTAALASGISGSSSSIEAKMKKQLQQERKVLLDKDATRKQVERAKRNIKYIVNYFKEQKNSGE